MVRTQIQLTEGQARTMKRIAIEEGTSVAEVIRRAVEKMMESRPKISAQERVRRAMEIAGKFRSGKRDVSRKHDNYLAEAYEK
jgi:Arc/MetJ-type ribon-helix-helix transcriptional regulator